MGRKKVNRAGVIPYIMNENGDVEIMFMTPSDPKYGTDLPQIAKGKCEDGETDEEAGLREGNEELGLFKGNISGDVHNLGTFLGRTTIFVFEIEDKGMFGDTCDETKETTWMTPDQFEDGGRDLHKPVVKAAVRYIVKKEGKKKKSLDEMELVLSQPNQNIDITKFDFINGEQVGSGEGGLPIMKSEHDGLIGFAFIQDDKPVAAVYGKPGLKQSDYFVIFWAWTDPKYRRKGLISALYVGLYQKIGLKLVSDSEQSPEMKHVWDNLSLPVKVVNTSTWKTYDRKHISDEKLYDGNQHLRLMLEYYIQDKTKDPIGIPQKYKLNESCLTNNVYNAEADILKDYLKFTHPDNEGRYI